jgi:hypothetical protein
MHRQGRNRRQVLLPDKGMGAGTTTFMSVLEKATRYDTRACWRCACDLARSAADISVIARREQWRCDAWQTVP